MSASALLASAPAFQSTLLDWYRTHRRRLPWREEPSLYRTVVSEFMLQQTQIKTMLPYFERWMATLPDFAALAAASEAEVVKLWEGLGYYTRARNLHRLARVLVALPEPPSDAAGWRALPGVGPYTAAAVASIAFHAPAAVVDGNVVRILARLTADATPHRDSASAAKAFTAVADALLNHTAPGDHNQAMMELGATVCVKHRPLCVLCPVRTHCAAARTGDPDAYPRLAPKTIETIHLPRAWCVRPEDGALLLHRTPDHARRLAGQHELPSAAHLGLAPENLTLAPPLAIKKRGITRYAFTEPIHPLAAAALPHPLPPGLVFVPAAQLAALLVSGPHRRWINELLARDV